MKKITIILNLLVLSFTAGAQSNFQLVEKVEPQDGKILIPYEKYTLPANDLTLIVHEDHSDPIVHVQVAYHVGSARESVRNSGFAHFFEHMMFEGSQNVKEGEHFKIIGESGGTNNAYTSFDKTVYHQTAPKNMTETLLWLEADRMGTHLESFTQKQFENQRETVKNEKRQRYDNQPYGMVSEILFKSMFANHPYEWTPIGYVDDLDIASYEDLKNFFLRWYGPNNATLIVSGDVNPEEVKAWAEKYFGSIKKCPEVKKMYPKKPQLSMDYYVNTVDNIFAPLTTFTFPTVPEFHRDEAALDILGEIIGGGNNSILYKNLVKTEEAFQANAGHSTLELAGMMSIQAVTLPESAGGMSFKVLEDKIRASIAEFETRGVTDEDLEITKVQVLKGTLGQLNSIDGKSGVLGHYAMMKGNGYNLQDDIDRYSAVTKEDVMRVYNKYIKGRKAVILRVEREAKRDDDDDTPKSVNPYANEPKKVDKQYNGLTYEAPKDDFDRSVRPNRPDASALKLPDFYSEEFDNGLKLIGNESQEAPLVYFYIDMNGGHLLESDKKINTGTAMVAASLMGEGTKRLTTEEFSRELEKIGASISFNSGTMGTTIFVSSLSSNVDATIALLKEALFEPRFDLADFKRIKKQIIEGLKSQKSNPSVMASKAWGNIVYAGTPLAEYYYGDYKSLSKIGLEDVISFYENFYSPNVSTLVVSGDITKEDALSKLAFLKEWKNKNVTVPSIPELKMPEKTTVYLVDKPYAAQSTIMAGHPSTKFDYNGDHFKSDIMNYSLGGAFNSRINLNLREDKGWTYGARSSFSGNKHYGVYRFSGEIKKEATDSAIKEVMKEISGFANNGITAEELEFTKNSMTLSEALDYETPFDKLNFLSTIMDYDLPKDYTSQQASLIKGMSIADVNAIAKSQLKPDNMVIIVVGHAYKVRDGLNKLGYGKIKEITVD
ncbi:insulinase family protein [Bacteroidia bacterium]|nr:insulinase family protein [Bacteroidia bacterium]